MEATADTRDIKSSQVARSEAPATPVKKTARRPLVILAGVAGVLAVGAGIYLLITAGQESTDDAQIEADVVPLAPRVGGQLLHVMVKENQHVKKGELLFEVDPADYQARVQAAEAELDTAKAQADAADAQASVTEASAKGGFSTARAAVSGSSAAVANADAGIATARAQLARAQADARKADLDIKRAQQLLADGAISQERFDNTQAASQSAQAQLQGAQAQVTAAEESRRAALTRVDEAKGRFEGSSPVEAQIASAHANAVLAHAKVKNAEAQLTLAKLQLDYTRVTAPTEGDVSKLGSHEGALISAGQSVAELVPTATYILANFKETQLTHMKEGQRVDVAVDAYPGHDVEGKVESLSYGTGARFSLLPPDNASGNFVKVVQRVPVRIAWVKVPDGVALRAGLSAEVTVHTK